MKYGVVVYKDSRNIGDDIQSYAAAALLPQVDYYIEREHLDIFRPNEQEPVNVIINGWLMFNKLGWPISPCINPLYLSVHFWENDALNINGKFLEGLGGEDLYKHQPIGCRDKETQDFLNKAGFKTWFSGCITLTLKNKYEKKEEDYICLVDVSPTVESFIRTTYPYLDIRVIHHESKTIIRDEMTWETRFENVEKLLGLYQNAQAVITTRLHCAMPCLGLETPVLLLKEGDTAEKGRFEGLYALVNNMTEEEFLTRKKNYDLTNPPRNPETYRSIRKQLEQAVRKFIEENSICTQQLKDRFKLYDKQWEERALWKNRIITYLMHTGIEKWKEDHSKWEILQKGKDWLEEQYNVLREEVTRIQLLNKKIEEQKNEISENNTRLNTEKDILCKKNELLNQKYNELYKVNLQIKDENTQLQVNNIALSDENEYLNEVLVNLTKYNEKLQQEKEEYYNNILELKNSFSWKIGRICTAIPRKIVSFLNNKNLVRK